ncbi:MAG TPA: hypothetical protein PKK06_04335 [Phycisphaerae bacterium]|nr:hypothetical protein [Phycisphaerae bacterium]HNU46183.1 hypothetical protein [Phycisphaerae bacterium]
MAQAGKLSVKAILTGLLVDVVGSVVLLVVIGVVVGLSVGADASAGYSRLAQDAIIKQKIERIAAGPTFLGLTFFLAALLTVLSGFVTGKLARGREVVNALAMGVVLVVLGLIVWGLSPSTFEPVPLYYMVAGLLVCIPAAVLGGSWVQKRAAATRRPESAESA